MSRHSAAHYFLEGLVDLGVDYIFANLGTDHVSLIEEIARWDREGLKHPEVILCPHEVVAVPASTCTNTACPLPVARA